MNTILKIKGVVQHYDWGGDDLIPRLLHSYANGQPFAEYWLGAHEKAPSIVNDGNNTLPLTDFINKNSIGALGERVAEKFGRLPFLFKVLDVKNILSIQVHPNKHEAKIGFDKENERGIPIDAQNRNFKDNNHKPEIMVALSDFWLLHGFLPEEEMIKTLKNTSELNGLTTVFKREGYKGVYRGIMEEDQNETNSTLQPLINRILPDYRNGKLEMSSSDYWAAKAYETFCMEGNIDKGIYSIYFFNIVKVNSGEGIYQGAGVPHSYLQGQNIELMASSDNVFRGGLTSKNINVQEFLKHVKFEATHPQVLKGVSKNNGLETVYESNSPDFELSRIELTERQTYNGNADTLEIWLVYEGKAIVSSRGETMEVKKGKAFILLPTVYRIKTNFYAKLFKAKTP